MSNTQNHCEFTSRARTAVFGERQADTATRPEKTSQRGEINTGWRDESTDGQDAGSSLFTYLCRPHGTSQRDSSRVLSQHGFPMQPRATRFKMEEGETTLRWKSDTWSTRFIAGSDRIGNNKINQGENIPSLKPVAWSRARGIRWGLSEATAKRTNPNTPASSAALAAFQQAAVATGANHGRLSGPSYPSQRSRSRMTEPSLKKHTHTGNETSQTRFRAGNTKICKKKKPREAAADALSFAYRLLSSPQKRGPVLEQLSLFLARPRRRNAKKPTRRGQNKPPHARSSHYSAAHKHRLSVVVTASESSENAKRATCARVSLAQEAADEPSWWRPTSDSCAQRANGTTASPSCDVTKNHSALRSLREYKT
ncbi:hypothetical protein MRX96_024900 [Rhipicephalus microplus]